MALLCCRPDPDSAAQERITGLLAGIDVQRFLDLVIRRHRIGPLVHARLKALPHLALPPGLLRPLEAEARSNAFASLRAARTHALLSRSFAERGIDWLPFKGYTLAVRYYADAGQRQVNDFDIWVTPAQLGLAREALAKLGFRRDPAAGYGDLAERGPKHRAFLDRYLFEETHYSGEHGAIDLHWQLTEDPTQFRGQAEPWLQECETLVVAGLRLPVMRSEDLLIYLCEHGGRHGWLRLKWLADLPLLLAGQNFDWPWLLRRARAAGCERSLRLGLLLSRDLLGWQAPVELTPELNRLPHRAALRWLVYGLLRSPAAGIESHERTSRWLMLQTSLCRLLLADRWNSVRLMLWRGSLSPHDLRLMRFPDRWLPIYRLLRPLLIIWRRVGYHLRRGTGRSATSA